MATEAEKKTPVFDWHNGDFLRDPKGKIVTVTQEEAVEQIVIKAQQTARGLFLIYAHPEEPELDHTYGSDAWDILNNNNKALSEEARISELKRAFKEALIYDPWITDVVDIVIERLGTEEAEASFTVKHIFGETTVKGVSIANG